jgi:protein NrfD
MKEVEIARHSHLVDPFHVWGWEIPVYLFLGGLAAGIMIFSVLLEKRAAKSFSPWARRLPFATPILLSIGMLALFLDLEYKLHVYRFYLAFQPSSPMSWGAWILLIVYPASIGLGLANLSDTDQKALESWPWVERLRTLAVTYRPMLRWINLLVGAALGIYTGVLLGALGGARPMWNSALLGPLFLVSGASTGAALMMLFPLHHDEHDALRQWDMGTIALEVVLLFLFIIGLLTGGGQLGRDAASMFLGGAYTATFWSLVILAGLVIPFALKVVENTAKCQPTRLAPVLILVGGLSLRWVIVLAGQAG